jgi:vancomycin resistance protein YoaR
VKEFYKRKSRPHDLRSRGGNTAATKRATAYYNTRKRMRRRMIVGAVLILSVLLLVVLVADYLINEGNPLQTGSTGEPEESVETDSATGVQEEAALENETPAEASTATVLLGEFFTDYAWDPDPGRQSNLMTAAGAIDNTVLEPGEEFSALAALGSLDYEQAKVFANGGVDYEIGGGLCQISSTLFMAANYAGLEIVERNPHYAELPYIRPGFDATVWFGENGWGALDMRFKNNTDGNILIREFVNEDGFLVAQIWGEEAPDKTVSMDSERVEEDINRGLKWVTYKKVIDGNGRVVEDDILYETTYSYNPPVPEEFKHETNEPRGAGWLDLSNTTNWNDKDD